jgi:hypothetical protein
MGSNDQEKIKIAREYFIRIDLGLRSSASPPAAERGGSRMKSYNTEPQTEGD